MHLDLDLTIPSNHRFVRTTRRAIGTYLDAAGVAPSLRDDLVLAIDEACTNVVDHAFPEGAGAICIRLELSAEEVVVEVSDAGVGFDALNQPLAARGRLAVKGRGIELMRRLVDAVEMESPAPAGGTRIRFRHALPVPLSSLSQRRE
jgi:anti-sigma regulatory factor (Ser/Thr protein kinase)